MLFLLSKKESSNLRGAVPAVLALQTSDQVGGPSLANLPPSCSQTLKGSLFLELPSLRGSSWESLPKLFQHSLQVSTLYQMLL